jgi:simple sugar transport system ATP-binding protein
MPAALEVRNVTKRFGATVANDGVHLVVQPGEVHAVLGQNGAGKSTLMNILAGLYHPDAGEIYVHGRLCQIASPRHASDLGIQMVHQHFMLGLPYTVAENLVLGREPRRAGLLFDRRRAETIVRELSQRYNLAVEAGARIEHLSVGERQRVEILKALYRRAEILILDEPTAVLTPLEIQDLFRVIERLRADGKAILFITHKLREVMAGADRVTVLRTGRVIASRAVGDTSERELIELMVGQGVEQEKPARRNAAGPSVLAIHNLTAVEPRRRLEVLSVERLEVQAGEIVGVAGVEGNGQSELVETLTGLRRPSGGRMLCDGADLAGLPPRRIRERGVACIHEDRQSTGLIAEFSLRDNLVLGSHYQRAFQRGLILNSRKIRATAEALLTAYDVQPPQAEMQARYLSGGNQQKLVAARELSRGGVRLLIASQPSRGLDIGATAFIHRKLREARDGGAAVLLFSADLDEVKLLSDRIAVMYRGRVVADRPAGGYTDAELGAFMLRGSLEAA